MRDIGSPDVRVRVDEWFHRGLPIFVRDYHGDHSEPTGGPAGPRLGAVVVRLWGRRIAPGSNLAVSLAGVDLPGVKSTKLHYVLWQRRY